MEKRHVLAKALAALVFSAVLSHAGLASGQPTGAHVMEGVETFDPLNLFGGGPVGGVLAFGEVLCQGYEPGWREIVPGQPACEPGSAFHVRGFVTRRQVHPLSESDRERLEGWATVVAGYGMDEEGGLRAYGTWSLDLDAGGSWQGTCTGYRNAEPEDCAGERCWIERITLVGHGTGGNVDGLTIRGTLERAWPELLSGPLPAWRSSVRVWIMGPER